MRRRCNSRARQTRRRPDEQPVGRGSPQHAARHADKFAQPHIGAQYMTDDVHQRSIYGKAHRVHGEVAQGALRAPPPVGTRAPCDLLSPQPVDREGDQSRDDSGFFIRSVQQQRKITEQHQGNACAEKTGQTVQGPKRVISFHAPGPPPRVHVTACTVWPTVCETCKSLFKKRAGLTHAVQRDMG